MESNSSQVFEEYPLSKIAVSSLQFDSTNPNKPTKEQIAAVKRSFRRFGYLVPIIVNENMQIGDGEHRALIYKEMGLQTIPGYIVPKINDDIERRLLRQTMNKLRGEHDIKLDADEIALIFQNDKLEHLSELIAQDRQALENILTKHKGIHFQHEDDFDVNKTLEQLVPETQLGDIWQLGEHRIMCADCTGERNLKRLIDGGGGHIIKTAFLDPPYNIGQNYRVYDDDKKPVDDYSEFIESVYKSVISINNEMNIIVTPGPRNVAIWSAIAIPKDFGTWYESNSESGASAFHLRKCEPILFYGKFKKRVNDFFDYPIDVPGSYRKIEHQMVNYEKGAFSPAKPIRLIADLINSYTEINDIILDPMLGTGTSLMACEQTNRICYGVEIDPHYVDVCVKRWEAYTNQKGQLIRKTETGV